MTIILDTTKKTVAVKEGVLMKDLIAELKFMLPNGNWEELTLVSYNEVMKTVEHRVIISNPVQYVTPRPVLPDTGVPPSYPWLTWNGKCMEVRDGVYQIDTTFTPADSFLLND